MFENKTEAQAREEILAMVAEYADRFHNQTKEFSPGDRIPYASRVYDKQEMVNLVDSSLEFWLTSGRYTDEFEKKLAEYLHVRYCSLVNSGSSANLVAFMALTSPLLGERRVKRGDEIITVAAGFPTTVTPAIQYGAVPVFVDVTIPQYNIDVSMLEAALSEKTKAVMLAHTLGNPFDLQAVKEFCKKHDLWLVEETTRYIYRIMAIKQIFENPSKYGFVLRARDLYKPIPTVDVAVSQDIQNLSAFAKEHGITYADLKRFNPWLRDRKLVTGGKTYKLSIPQEKDMYYKTPNTEVYDSAWVVSEN